MFDGIIDQLEEDTSAWSNTERVEFLREKERLIRRLQSMDHGIINQLVEQGAPAEFGGVKLAELLANELGVSRADAAERARAAKDLGSTTPITGEVLPPRLVEAAEAQALENRENQRRHPLATTSILELPQTQTPRGMMDR